MFLLNSRRFATVIGLEIRSTHAKLMFFLRPLMSWASFSRSVDTGVTGRVSTNSQTCVAPDWRMSCIEPEATGATILTPSRLPQQLQQLGDIRHDRSRSHRYFGNRWQGAERHYRANDCGRSWRQARRGRLSANTNCLLREVIRDRRFIPDEPWC